MKQLFFVTPIGADDSDERKRSDQFMKYLLEPIAGKLNYEVTRVDKLSQVDKIDNTITTYIKTSDLVVVDMSDLNANVFYEFGYRQALGLPLIPVITKGVNIPFDVANLRTIFYDLTDLDAVASVKDKLEETMLAVQTDLPEMDNINQGTAMPSTTLLSIQDKLDKIIELVGNRNEGDIERTAAIVARYSQPNISPETAIAQQVMSSLLENPAMKQAINKKINDGFNA